MVTYCIVILYEYSYFINNYRIHDVIYIYKYICDIDIDKLPMILVILTDSVEERVYVSW